MRVVPKVLLGDCQQFGIGARRVVNECSLQAFFG
jgi:hypothetical protein